MISVQLQHDANLDEWRDHARRLLAAGITPQEICWSGTDESTSNLFADEDVHKCSNSTKITVPRTFIQLAAELICYRSNTKFHLIYELLWRLQAEQGLLRNLADPLVCRLNSMAREVRRDIHKMRAFVRFRDAGLSDAERRRFVAWFEPSHLIVERNAPFFADRFGDMDWTIATPDRCAHFEDGELRFSPGIPKPESDADKAEELWRTYYSSIFNPARVKVKAMQAEMPKKYWKNLPEAQLIPELLASVEPRLDAMYAAQASQPPVRADRLRAQMAGKRAGQPEDAGAPLSLAELRDRLKSCKRCPLHACATQVVAGEGPDGAEVMFVGEQPGDKEDLAGKPFAGPAGKLFDEALAEAGIRRSTSYVTNAVKHFKYEPRGKHRLHKRPNAQEVQACRWWLRQEIELVKPRLVVALGSTALFSLTGDGSNVLMRRGNVEHTPAGISVLATLHPSAILRASDMQAAKASRDAFVTDLRRAAEMLQADTGSEICLQTGGVNCNKHIVR